MCRSMEKEGSCSAKFMRNVIVVGLTGASNGGKTTLSQRLAERHPSAIVVHQDDFYKEEDLVPWNAERDFRLWDVVEALDVDKLVGEVQSSISKAVQCRRELWDAPKSDRPPSLVIVEGTKLLSIRALEPFLTVTWFITLNYDTMRERRRNNHRVRLYDGVQDVPGYFDNYVWHGYMRDLKNACNAHKDGSIRMLDGTSENLEEVDAVISELLKEEKANS